VLKCFREADGKMLWQLDSRALPKRVNDFGWRGLGCSPMIVGDRLWLASNRCEVICLDIAPLKQRGEEPRVKWHFDMKELGVFPRALMMGPSRTCSISTPYKGRIYVVTGNGVAENWVDVPSPKAPGLICLDADTGELLWSDNSPGGNILVGQMSSPLVVEIDGRGQVIVSLGDGWLRSFDAITGKLIWKFDMNFKESVWKSGGRCDRNYVLATPVFYDGHVYLASGHQPEHGEGPGRLCCIDPTRTGDVSSQLVINEKGKSVPPRRTFAADKDAGERVVDNPNSALVWEFAKRGEKFEDSMYRSISNVAIKNDLVIATDFSGLVHCLNAKTGKRYWYYDTFAAIWASPLIVDDKVYVGDEDGDVAIFELSANDKQADHEQEPITETIMDNSVLSAPIFANGVMYVATRGGLHAIGRPSERDAWKPGYWPQWRGPNRDNVSPDTRLLAEWEKDGPPLIWRVHNLGKGIASVSVGGGRIYTVGQHEEVEYLYSLDERTGSLIWSRQLDEAIRQSSLMRWLSQRSPTLDKDRLYAVTASGKLFCIRVSDGSVAWQKDYVKDFAGVRRSWGYCDYPLVDGGRLICAPGGKEASVVALDKHSGEIVWKTSLPGDVPTQYAATVVSGEGQDRQYVVFLRKSLVGLAAADGRLLWRYDKNANGTANSYTPIVHKDWILSPNGYGTGLALLKQIKEEGERPAVREVYYEKLTLDPFQDSTVLIGDALFAFRSSAPVCFDWKSGRVRWGPERLDGRRGKAALTYADGHLYLRHSEGQLTLIEANPDRLVEKGTFSIPDHERSIGSTFPVVTSGRMLVRDNDNLFCYDVRRYDGDRPESSPLHVELPDVTGSEVTRRRKPSGPDAPFVPTPQVVVDRMLLIADIKKSDIVYDLGSGDGRIVVTAARTYGVQSVGIEIDRGLVADSRKFAEKEDVSELARFEQQDLFEADFNKANVVTVFLFPQLLKRLLPKLNQLAPGTRVVSHQFEIPGVKPKKTVELRTPDGELHTIYLYTVPLTDP
jgi:outer membrane protein assembly factor BamB